MDENSVRDHLARALAWKEARATYAKAVDGLPASLRGRVPPGLPYSAWQIIEHIRLAQADILEFCVNPAYEEREWPAAYWPAAPEPPSAAAWDDSVTSYHRDLAALQTLAADPAVDLTSKIPHGNGQTYMRELLLVVDHTAYHVGELIVLRRLLGAWK